MTIGKDRRPRDPNQLAKWIVDQDSSENPIHEQEAAPKGPPLSPVELSKHMAAKGGSCSGC